MSTLAYGTAWPEYGMPAAEYDQLSRALAPRPAHAAARPARLAPAVRFGGPAVAGLVIAILAGLLGVVGGAGLVLATGHAPAVPGLTVTRTDAIPPSVFDDPAVDTTGVDDRRGDSDCWDEKSCDATRDATRIH